MWYAVVLGVFGEWYCRNSICPVIGMGEGIAGVRMLVGFGVASWGELMGGYFVMSVVIVGLRSVVGFLLQFGYVVVVVE